MKALGINLVAIVASMLCYAASVGAAMAAPPASRAAAFQHPGDSIATRAGGLRSASLRVDSAHLDLRLPAESLPNAASSASSENAFPSSRRAQPIERPEDELPQLGSDRAAPLVRSRAEEIVRRIHREGVPLARLFENHSTLVSLGLNPRGKPGIWLIQKIP